MPSDGKIGNCCSRLLSSQLPRTNHAVHKGLLPLYTKDSRVTGQSQDEVSGQEEIQISTLGMWHGI